MKLPRVAPRTPPHALRKLDRWVCWRIEERDSGPTKVPMRALGFGRASTINFDTWSSYSLACSTAQQNSWGIGFVLHLEDGITCIDLDHVVDGRHVHKDAWKLVKHLDTYTELSPSRTGLHLWVRAAKTTGRCKKTGWPQEGMAIEAYDHRRFITMTGQCVWSQPMRACSRKMNVFLAEVLGQAAVSDPSQVVYTAEPWDGQLPERIIRWIRGDDPYSKQLRAFLSRSCEDLGRFDRFKSLSDQSDSGVDMSVACTLANRGASPSEIEYALRWRRSRIGGKSKSDAYYRNTVLRSIDLNLAPTDGEPSTLDKIQAIRLGG